MSEADVSGWNAFDEPTQQWLRERLAAPVVLDCFGEVVSVAGELSPVETALKDKAKRAPHLAKSMGLRPEAVEAALRALEVAGRVRRDDEGFWSCVR